MCVEVYTIEFQKRVLPHAHILLFLEPFDKISSLDRIDALIYAEIPTAKIAPRLHNLAKTHMMHGPCGANFTKAS